MGSLLAKLIMSFQSTPTKVLMLGLDSAGKTTILYKMKLNEIICTTPTVGFNLETVTPIKGVTFTICDMGGQNKFRLLWKRYPAYKQGLFFVVDSADISRMSEAKRELYSIFEDPELTGIPVVVLANKQDLYGALSPSAVADKLCLHELTDRKWFVQGTWAETGDGISEGMQMMARLIKESNDG